MSKEPGSQETNVVKIEGDRRIQIMSSPGDIKLGTPGKPRVVFLRHGVYLKDKKNPDNPRIGTISDDWAESFRDDCVNGFRNQFEMMTEEERVNQRFIFAASPTSFGKSQGQRAVETSDLITDALIQVLKYYNIDPEVAIINNAFNHSETRQELITDTTKDRLSNRNSNPILHKLLVEPKMLDSTLPDHEYFKYLTDKYGPPFVPKREGDPANIFFVAYDKDEGDDREARMKMGAEGPKEMLTRFKKGLELINRGASLYDYSEHKKNPGTSVTVIAVGHTDYISPMIHDLAGLSEDQIIIANEGSGFTYTVEPNNKRLLQNVEIVAKEGEAPLDLDRKYRI